MGQDARVSEAVFSWKPGTIAREVEGEVLIVPVRDRVVDLDDCFYVLDNPVSVHLWGLLETTHTLDALALAVAGTFEVEEQVAKADVSQFLDDLVRVGACQTE
jgi:hypothetical protein